MPTSTAKAIFDAAAAHMPSLRLIDLQQLLSFAARCHHTPSAAWMATAQSHSLPLLSGADSHFVSNALWALATLQYAPSGDWLDACVAHLKGHMPQYTPQGLANVLWALTTLDYLPKAELLQDLYLEAYARCDAFEPRGICMLLWSAANLPHRPPLKWVQAMLAAGARSGSNSNSGGGGGSAAGLPLQSVVSLLHSAAKLDQVPEPEVLLPMLAALQANVSRCSCQALTNSLWALTRLQQQQQLHVAADDRPSTSGSGRADVRQRSLLPQAARGGRSSGRGRLAAGRTHERQQQLPQQQEPKQTEVAAAAMQHTVLALASEIQSRLDSARGSSGEDATSATSEQLDGAAVDLARGTAAGDARGPTSNGTAGFLAEELAIMAFSLGIQLNGDLALRPAAGSAASSTSVGLPSAGREPLAALLQDVLAACRPHLPRLQPQELSMLLKCAASRNARTPKAAQQGFPCAGWLADWVASAAEKLPLFNARDLSSALHSLAMAGQPAR